MRIMKAVVLVWMLLCSAVASAVVVYEWQTISTSPSIQSAVGIIRVTDAAWESGTANFFSTSGGVYPRNECSPAPLSPCPYFDIVSIYFNVNDSQYPVVVLPHIDQFSTPHTFSFAFDSSNILGVSGMSGGLATANFVSSLQMSGASSLWTIHSFASDAGCRNPVGNNQNIHCEGATGRWVLTGIPEPATLALLGLGLLGFAARRRRA